jgi:hypothetical protein
VRPVSDSGLNEFFVQEHFLFLLAAWSLTKICRAINLTLQLRRAPSESPIQQVLRSGGASPSGFVP